MTTARAGRRTQAERRAATKGKLLDAALSCLVDLGYDGTTLSEVVSRAGVTNGALWRYYPTKAALLTDVAVLCEQRLTAALATPVGSLPMREAIARLWEQADDEALQALVELVRAGRRDEELRDALQKSDARAAQLFHEALEAALGPELAGAPGFRRNVKLLGLTLYGTALTSPLRTPVARRRLVKDVQELAADLFPTAEEVEQCG